MSIKIDCSTEVKQQNRKMIRDWVRKHYTSKQLSKAKVLCLPGWQCLEIYEIWDKLGVRRKNIYAITNDKKEYDEIRKVRGVNVILGDLKNRGDIIDKLLANDQNISKCKHQYTVSHKAFNTVTDMYTYPFFDIIYLDVYGNTGMVFDLAQYGAPLLKNNGLFGVTTLSAREKCGQTKAGLSAARSFGRGRRFFMLGNIVVGFLNYGLEFSIKRDKSDYITFSEKGEKGLQYIYSKLKKSYRIKKHRSQLFNILKHNFYPTDFFKSKYITSKGTPMSTALIKVRKISTLNKFNFDRVIYTNAEKMGDVETIRIKDTANKKPPKEDAANKHTQPMAIGAIEDHLRKQGIEKFPSLTEPFQNCHIWSTENDKITLWAHIDLHMSLLNRKKDELSSIINNFIGREVNLEIKSRASERKKQKEAVQFAANKIKAMPDSQFDSMANKHETIEYLKEFDDKADLNDISEMYGYSIPQLRAFKAHITMGTYGD
jgi:hypothetical protein